MLDATSLEEERKLVSETKALLWDLLIIANTKMPLIYDPDLPREIACPTLNTIKGAQDHSLRVIYELVVVIKKKPAWKAKLMKTIEHLASVDDMKLLETLLLPRS